MIQRKRRILFFLDPFKYLGIFGLICWGSWVVTAGVMWKTIAIAFLIGTGCWLCLIPLATALIKTIRDQYQEALKSDLEESRRVIQQKREAQDAQILLMEADGFDQTQAKIFYALQREEEDKQLKLNT